MKLQITTKKKELEAKVAILRAGVDGLRNRVALLENERETCPACGHRRTKDG